MVRTAEAIIGAANIEALRRPIDEARGLPGAAYTSQAFFDLEQECMFRRTWMCVGFESDIQPAMPCPSWWAATAYMVRTDQEVSIP